MVSHLRDRESAVLIVAAKKGNCSQEKRRFNVKIIRDCHTFSMHDFILLRRINEESVDSYIMYELKASTL